MLNTSAIDVWYVCDEVLCNFDCAYCTTQTARRAAGNRVWATEESAARYRTILAWMAGLPWRLRIRLQTLGEPFMSQDFLRGAAHLASSKNVEFVELVTNGSFTDRQFSAFAATTEIEKISLWMTYHHGQIEAEVLVSNARMAASLGAFVVVHALLFPDNRDAIERLVKLCKAADLRTDVTIGHNFNNAYPTKGLLAILETQPNALVDLYRHTAALQTMAVAHRGPRGELCSAGHDYIRVYADGEVYPCAPYRGVGGTRLGNALAPGFVPVLRTAAYAPCRAEGFCGCKEDHFHLKAARTALRFNRSLGYYEVSDGAIVHVGGGNLAAEVVVR
jgi:MoaA/NifB/PqqE/SkfB family radical SAM enzyme